MTLEQALYLARQGYMSREDWEHYAHMWQTSAPRFSTRACNCAECILTYPTPEYKPLSLGF